MKRWSQAFPDAFAVAGVADISSVISSVSGALWVDGRVFTTTSTSAKLEESIAQGPPVVLMSSTPNESEAFQALNLGAAGYCHLHSAAQQLSEIALVVLNNGIWMPPELLQRFLRLSVRVASEEASEEVDLQALTARERVVAEEVAVGATNREIAARLQITERTVKSHLTAIFEKLQVRDRVQLALVMNNVAVSAAVL